MLGTGLMDDVEANEMMQAFGDPTSKGELIPSDGGFTPIAQGVQIHDGIITARRVEVERDEAKILQKIAARAAVAGTDWFYRFPVKKKGGGQEFIQGPSIKCANNVARLYGNCQVDVRVQDVGASWIIYARFVDYETGFSYTRPFQQAKNASRMGGAGPEADARRLDIALQIGASKAIRNVICNALEHLTDFAFAEAQKNLVGRVGKDLDRYKARVKERLESMKVDIKRVELTVGRTFDKWLAPDVAQIIAELQAIQDGMATIDETWAPLEPKRDQFQDEPKKAAETVQDQPANQAEARPAEEKAKPQPAAEPEKPKRSPWAIADSVVGQEPRRKAIVDLLELAKVKADVDEIREEHKDFLEKLGRVKAETMRAFDERQAELPEKAEAEE